LNTGETREKFEVVIAGSNGYLSNSAVSIPGYSSGASYDDAAINAPYDQNGYNTYLGSAIFQGTFDPKLCATACSQKSDYARAHPPADGSPVATCQFFNTYILYVNTPDNVQGQYCAMYAESWGPSYATNKGQYRGSDQYLIQYSFGYSNSTNAGSPNPQAAVYQARNDILWPANSAQGFCSSLLGYTTPVVTVTSATTTTPVSVTLQTVTITSVGETVTATSVITTSITVTPNAKRDISDPTMTVINGITAPALPTIPSISTQAPQKRALSTPNVLTKYPGSILTSACSLAVKPVSSTSTITVTSTQTANTVLTTQQSSVTTLITSSITVSTTTTATQFAQCTPAYRFVIADGPRAGQYITEDSPNPSAITYGFVKFTSDATAAVSFKLAADGQVQSSDGVYGWTTRKNDLYYILDMTENARSTYLIDKVICSIVSPAPAGVTGAIGTLSCQDSGGQVYLISTPQTGANLIKAKQLDSRYTVLTVAVVPDGTCS